ENMAGQKYLPQGRVVFPVGLKYDEKKSHDRGHPCKALDPPPPQGWQQLTMASVGQSFRLNSLGLVTGPVSGVLAVDIDNMELWKVLLDTMGKTEPLTCRSISQRRAVHLLFKVTPALEAVRRKGVFGMKALGYNDFDILGQGDFLLVPPSSFETLEGHREYKFVEGYSLIDNPDKLLDAPEWLINVLTRGSNKYRRVREAYLKQTLVAEKAEKVASGPGPDTNKDARSARRASTVEEGLTAEGCVSSHQSRPLPSPSSTSKGHSVHVRKDPRSSLGHWGDYWDNYQGGYKSRTGQSHRDRLR
ncbi:hypothetical protein HK102_010531, partial [Quaeritorhiza haematococci]